MWKYEETLNSGFFPYPNLFFYLLYPFFSFYCSYEDYSKTRMTTSISSEAKKHILPNRNNPKTFIHYTHLCILLHDHQANRQINSCILVCGIFTLKKQQSTLKRSLENKVNSLPKKKVTDAYGVKQIFCKCPYQMKCWNCYITAIKSILEYALQNVTISYNKIEYGSWEMLAIFEMLFQFDNITQIWKVLPTYFVGIFNFYHVVYKWQHL